MILKNQKLKTKVHEHLYNIKRVSYYMRVTNNRVKMYSLGGRKHAPYDIALDYVPERGIVYSFGLGDQI